MNINIWKDEATGLYTLEANDTVYECLATDEVIEIVKDLTEGSEQK